VNNENAFDKLLGGDPDWEETLAGMTPISRVAVAGQIYSWGAERYAAGRASAMAELHPLWHAEKERAGKLEAAGIVVKLDMSDVLKAIKDGNLAQELIADGWMPPGAAAMPEKVVEGMTESQEPKYGIRDGRLFNRASGEFIPADEPVFIFRARDHHAMHVLAAYEYMGLGEKHAQAVAGRIRDFQRFAQTNPARMKEPDTHATPPYPAPQQAPAKEGYCYYCSEGYKHSCPKHNPAPQQAPVVQGLSEIYKHTGGNLYEKLGELSAKVGDTGWWQGCIRYRSLKDGKEYVTDAERWGASFVLVENATPSPAVPPSDAPTFEDWWQENHTLFVLSTDQESAARAVWEAAGGAFAPEVVTSLVGQVGTGCNHNYEPTGGSSPMAGGRAMYFYECTICGGTTHKVLP